MRAGAGRAATLFPLLLAGLLAGVTYWLDIASRPTLAQDDGKTRHDPDYIVENFVVQRFDPAGKLQHTLQASELRHYPDDDSTTIQAPLLIWHRSPDARITAHQAQFDSEGKHAQLIGDVRMTRAGVTGKPPSLITTAHLDVWPEEERASTATAVSILQGRSRLDGRRMEADNKAGSFVLEGPVTGLFHRTGKTQAERTASAPDTKVARETAPKTKSKAKSRSKPHTKPKSRARGNRPQAKR